ncbi:MAG: hypothetical protein ACOCXH_02815 [Cyclobacteriaceae bacterium]
MKKSFLYLFVLSAFLPNWLLATNEQSILNKVVSLQLQNESIATGLQKLQQNHQVYFSYVNQLDDLQQIKNIDIRKVALDSVLNELLRDTNIKFYELYDQVVLIEKELVARYNLDVMDSMEKNPDTVRVFNITYLQENARESKMSVADLWRTLMLQKVISEYDSGFTLVRYDTLANPDTVKIMIDSIRSKPKLKIALKASRKNWHHSLTLRPDLMVTRWSMSSDNIQASELNQINDYGNPEISFSTGMLYTLRYKFVSLQTGLELNLIKRESRHQETLINLANDAEQIREERNVSQYNYLSIPMMAGFNLGWENMYFQFSGGFQFNFLSSYSGATFYPIYETIYYNVTLNLLYDADNNFLEKKAVNLRDSFTTLRFQLMSYFEMNEHFYFTGGFIYRNNNQSIYTDAAPVAEVFRGFSISAGISYSF